MIAKETDVVVVGGGAGGVLAARSVHSQGLSTTLVEQRPQEQCTFPWWVEVDTGAVLQHQVPHPAPGVPLRLPSAGADFISPSRRRAVHLAPSPLYGWALSPYLDALRHEIAGAGASVLYGHVLRHFAPEPRGRVRCVLDGPDGSVTYSCQLLVLATGSLTPVLPMLQELGFVLPHSEPIQVHARHESWALDPTLALTASWPSTVGTSVNILATASAFSTLGFWIRPDGRQATLLAGVVRQPGSLSPDQLLEGFRNEHPGVFLTCQEQAEIPLPLARPIPTMAGRGVAILGSAARQVWPMTGSAISLTGKAAALLGGAAARYCATQDPAALWQYGKEYMTTYGASQAFGEGLTRTLLRNSVGQEMAEAMFESGYVDAAQMHRVLSFRPLDLRPKEIPSQVRSLLRRPMLARLFPGISRALLAFTITQSTYPDSFSPRRLQAFEDRLCSILE